MAFEGFSHTGTPGGANGLGTDIRATMAGNAGFTANWTVHPEVLFGSGATEKSLWVCEHASGLQVLFYVLNGASAAHVTSTYRNASFTGTALTVWLALDPIGGGVGSSSFFDNLYNNGLDPTNLSFWDQTEKSDAVRAVEWFTGAGLCTLWFVYDTVLNHLLVYSRGNGTGRISSISTVCLSGSFTDNSRRAVGDRLPKFAGLLAVQAGSDAQGNDVVGYERYLFPGGVDRDVESGGTDIILDFYRFATLLAGADPGVDGRYITQTIPMKINRGGTDPGPNNIIGEIDRSLARFCRADASRLGKRQDGGNLMRAQTPMMWAWSDALGDIIP